MLRMALNLKLSQSKSGQVIILIIVIIKNINNSMGENLIQKIRNMQIGGIMIFMVKGGKISRRVANHIVVKMIRVKSVNKNVNNTNNIGVLSVKIMMRILVN